MMNQQILDANDLLKNLSFIKLTHGVLYLNNIILLSQPDALYLNDDTKMKTYIEIFNNIFIYNEAMC